MPRSASLLALVLLVPMVALAKGDGGAAPAPDSVQKVVGTKNLWAGHQVVLGYKDIPLLGKVQTRTDTYFIATFVKMDSGWVLKQQACSIEIKPTMGVKVQFPDHTVGKLPTADVTLTEAADGYYYATPWKVGWGKEDVDHDGHPGVTLDVDAPLCSGKVYVTSESFSRARAKRTADMWVGQIRVQIRQHILGASKSCLKLMSSDTDERIRGTFAYTRIPDGSTCSSLAKSAWPTRAAEPHK